MRGARKKNRADRTKEREDSMWIVKNSLRATLSFRGLGVSIPSGAEFDLDAIGRDTAEQSPQVVVALEEGYLTNVFKAAREAGHSTTVIGAAPLPDLSGLVTSKDFEAFKQQFLTELRNQLPALQKLDKLDSLGEGQTGVNLKNELEGFRKSLADDVKAAADEIKQVARDKILQEKRKILSDQSLTEAEMKLRISFLEEKERELVTNFENVGHKVEGQDGDVMDKADLLSGEI
jgi:hypothetical protein